MTGCPCLGDFRFFECYRLNSEGDEVTTARVWKGETDSVSLGVADDHYLTIPKGRFDFLMSDTTVEENFDGAHPSRHAAGNAHRLDERRATGRTTTGCADRCARSGVLAAHRGRDQPLVSIMMREDKMRDDGVGALLRVDSDKPDAKKRLANEAAVPRLTQGGAKIKLPALSCEAHKCLTVEYRAYYWKSQE